MIKLHTRAWIGTNCVFSLTLHFEKKYPSNLFLSQPRWLNLVVLSVFFSKFQKKICNFVSVVGDLGEYRVFRSNSNVSMQLCTASICNISQKIISNVYFSFYTYTTRLWEFFSRQLCPNHKCHHVCVNFLQVLFCMTLKFWNMLSK